MAAGRRVGAVSSAPAVMFLLVAVVHLAALRGVSAGCYFAAELQGDFVMQSTVTAGSEVQYSALNISAESIPIWGHCHRRLGSNVLLMDDSGGARCIRCFHLSLRSRNVLSVLTEGLDKCYTSEEAAVATCPGEAQGIGSPPQPVQSLDRHSQEILLFKTSGLGGEQIQSEYCPLDGRFSFLYSSNEGSGCRNSEMENCPAGSGLHFRFRGCSFPDRDITFQCLGHWPGPNSQRYIAFLETSTTGKTRARYRCALYREDASTGVISMAFSSDSTCSSDLRSATDGFETMKLSPHAAFHWPQALDPSPCSFPTWAQGRWEHMAVEGNTLVFRDHKTFTTYTFRCLTTDERSRERSLIFGRTQCGEEIYTCIWMKERGLNVLEFQLGQQSSSYINESLCRDSNFRDDAWLTQGRMDVFVESPCPIAGEYTGFIPDDSGLCAKLYSDCTRPEIMFYTVSDCTPEPEVYEGSRRDVPFKSVRGPSMPLNPIQTGSGIFHITDPRPNRNINLESYVTSFSSSVENQGRHSAISPIPSFSYSFTNAKTQSLHSVPTPISSVTYNLYPTQRHITSAPRLIQHLLPPEYPRINHTARVDDIFLYNRRSRSANRELEGRRTTTSNPLDWDDFETEYDPWTFPQLHGHKNTKEVNTERSTMTPTVESPLPTRTSSLLTPQFPHARASPTSSPHLEVISNSQRASHPSKNDPISNPCSDGAETLNFFNPSANRRVGYSREKCRSYLSSRNSRLPDVPARKMEEREYRCLGQWEEGGVMYTYTQRRDLGSYECFVGSIVTRSEIYIKEAGEHCQRNVDPIHYGMKLTKKGSCQSLQDNNGPSAYSTTRPYPTSSWYSSKKPPEPTKPWKPITGSPKGQAGIQNAAQKDIVNIYSSIFIVIFSYIL